MRRSIGRALLVLLAALAAFAAAVVLGGRPPPQPIPAAPLGPPVAFAAGAGEITREDLRFPCGTDRCAGWLYRPPEPAHPPIVVMAHGFAGTRDVALEPFALAFARRGMAAFVFDYRCFGASGGGPRQLIDPWRQIEDWHAAIAFVRGRPDVDGARLALWGTSLGAGHALIAAAEDGGVRAVVGQVPLVDTHAEGPAAKIGTATGLRLLLLAWADLVQSNGSDEALMVPAISPPGEPGLISDAAAFAAAKALAGADSTYRNAVAARSIVTFDEYDPAVQAAALDAPVLLIVSPGDRFAQIAGAKAYAASHAAARLAEIDGDHFDVYSSPRRERAAALAAAFLVEELEGPSGESPTSDHTSTRRVIPSPDSGFP